jgi:DNA-binding SARP family transcriptional activator
MAENAVFLLTVHTIIHLEHLVRDNPLTEEYYRRLISAYAGMGDLKSINSQYKRLISVLKDELGLTPSPEMQELYSRLIIKH